MHDYVFVTGGVEICPHYDSELKRVMYTPPDALTSADPFDPLLHTYSHEFNTSDWGFITQSDSVTIADTEVKSQYIGSDSFIQGEIDLTGVYGELYYKTRTGTLNFISQRHDNRTFKSKLVELFSGKAIKIIPLDDPTYYYEGRILSVATKMDQYWTTYSFAYKLRPFQQSVYANYNAYEFDELVGTTHTYPEQIILENVPIPIYRALWDYIDFTREFETEISEWANYTRNGVVAPNAPVGSQDALIYPVANLYNDSDFTITPSVMVIRSDEWPVGAIIPPDIARAALLSASDWYDYAYDKNLEIVFDTYRNAHPYEWYGSKNYEGRYSAWMLSIPPHESDWVYLEYRGDQGTDPYDPKRAGFIISLRQVRI